MCIQMTWVLTLSLVFTGCSHMGTRTLKRDQVGYNEAVSKANREQTLLNIVRLRYADWPMTLNVEQMVTQYNWEHVASGKMIWKVPFRGDNDQFEGGYVGKYSEKPVVAYKPVRGAEYTRSMLTPLHPAALLGLVYTGWPADRLMETMVHSVNGKQNSQVESGFELKPDPQFELFLKTARRFQLYDALIIGIDRQQQQQTQAQSDIQAHIRFETNRVDNETQQMYAQMQEALDLNPLTNSYNIIWGIVPPDTSTIAMETRSVLQLMLSLAAHVEVSEKEIEEGRVSAMKGRPKEDPTDLGPLIHVRRGLIAPLDAHVSCRYRGRSFWIDDTDVNSKITFSYLTMLLTLSETEDSGGAPLVITTN